jgi:hypothetical protein
MPEDRVIDKWQHCEHLAGDGPYTLRSKSNRLTVPFIYPAAYPFLCRRSAITFRFAKPAAAPPLDLSRHHLRTGCQCGIGLSRARGPRLAGTSALPPRNQFYTSPSTLI